ncbi:MAG: hypothetical protein ABFD90_01745 [Phycisphaerales bacterium]
MFCWFFRFMISNAADSDGHIGTITRWHALRCANCRQFHRTCRTLGKNLRAEAAALPATSRQFAWEVPASLPHAQRRPPARPAWSAIAAAACLAVVVLFVVPSRHIESPTPPAHTAPTPRMELPGAWAHMLETPLTTEVQRLSDDAQSGIRFLVACLDARPAETVVSPEIK